MRTGEREGKELHCPFCGKELGRPTTLKLDSSEEALGGACKTCGAFFIVDPTSKNVGEIMMQALSVAADNLSKNVADLVAGEDYEDAVLSYDWRTHRSAGRVQGFRDGYGRLYIVKWNKKSN